MTRLDLSLEVSDRLAREAREAGLLAPEALADLLARGVREKAADRISAARSRTGGGEPLSPEALQTIVAAVRKRRA